MKKLKLELGENSYPIYIGSGLLSKLELLTKYIDSKKVMIVTNETIAPLYLAKVKSLLTDYLLKEVILKDGEEYKTLKTANIIFTALLENKFNRDCTLIALGGGVIGDITGFVAASYQRGVNFIQIPTTLLAQVDSSVGGKTGVNHKLAKNMIGAFYHPKCVLIDIDTLDTLDNRQYSAGMSEVIKYGLLGNIELLKFLQDNIDELMLRDKSLIAKIIFQCCSDKANIVAKDELEKGQRALLNLGHTFGHAIENKLGYGVYLHGEAVAVGMLMAARLSELEGYLSAQEVLEVKNILKKANLPTKINAKINAKDILLAMLVDKKVFDGNMRLILLKSLGDAFICSNYKKDLLDKTINQFIAA
jgi:3-dehydroquinate synthase